VINLNGISPINNSYIRPISSTYKVENNIAKNTNSVEIIHVKCKYKKECADYKMYTNATNQSKCLTCDNNELRNKEKKSYYNK
jgi:hypothetical protein